MMNSVRGPRKKDPNAGRIPPKGPLFSIKEPRQVEHGFAGKQLRTLINKHKKNPGKRPSQDRQSLEAPKPSKKTSSKQPEL